MDEYDGSKSGMFVHTNSNPKKSITSASHDQLRRCIFCHLPAPIINRREACNCELNILNICHCWLRTSFSISKSRSRSREYGFEVHSKNIEPPKDSFHLRKHLSRLLRRQIDRQKDTLRKLHRKSLYFWSRILRCKSYRSIKCGSSIATSLGACLSTTESSVDLVLISGKLETMLKFHRRQFCIWSW